MYLMCSTFRHMILVQHIGCYCTGLYQSARFTLFKRYIYLSMYVCMYGCKPLWSLAAFSFSFLIYTQPIGLLGRGISLSQGLYLYEEQHKHRIKDRDIHASNEIRTHNPCVRAGEDSSLLIPGGHCDLQ
jgi:hypothetical protein